jgi:hypothetical protein
MYRELKCPKCNLSLGNNIKNNIALCRHCGYSHELVELPNLFLKRLFGVGKNSKWRTKVILNGLEIAKIPHGGEASFCLPLGKYAISFMASTTLIKSYEFEIKDEKTRVFIEIYTGRREDINSIKVINEY